MRKIEGVNEREVERGKKRGREREGELKGRWRVIDKLIGKEIEIDVY